jgi:hypothetical protein
MLCCVLPPTAGGQLLLTLEVAVAQVVNPYKRQFLVSWVAVLDRCAVCTRVS